MADGREIAYRLMSDGDGPLILHTAQGPYPVDLLDEDPMYDRFLRTLGVAGRVVAFDKPSTGSSDPIDPDRDFLGQMTEAYLAVADACEADAAWIVGSGLVAIAGDNPNASEPGSRSGAHQSAFSDSVRTKC